MIKPDPKKLAAITAQPCCAKRSPNVLLNPFFKVILDETRRELMQFIGSYPNLTAGEIAKVFAQDRSTISHHLSVMTTCGFLTMAKDGRRRRYRMNRDYIIKTLESITESLRNCCKDC